MINPHDKTYLDNSVNWYFATKGKENLGRIIMRGEDIRYFVGRMVEKLNDEIIVMSDKRKTIEKISEILEVLSDEKSDYICMTPEDVARFCARYPLTSFDNPYVVSAIG